MIFFWPEYHLIPFWYHRSVDCFIVWLACFKLENWNCKELLGILIIIKMIKYLMCDLLLRRVSIVVSSYPEVSALVHSCLISVFFPWILFRHRTWLIYYLLLASLWHLAFILSDKFPQLVIFSLNRSLRSSKLHAYSIPVQSSDAIHFIILFFITYTFSSSKAYTFCIYPHNSEPLPVFNSISIMSVSNTINLSTAQILSFHWFTYIFCCN